MSLAFSEDDFDAEELTDEEVAVTDELTVELTEDDDVVTDEALEDIELDESASATWAMPKVMATIARPVTEKLFMVKIGEE